MKIKRGTLDHKGLSRKWSGGDKEGEMMGQGEVSSTLRYGWKGDLGTYDPAAQVTNILRGNRRTHAVWKKNDRAKTEFKGLNGNGVKKRRSGRIAGGFTKAKGCLKKPNETPLVCKSIENIFKGVWIEACHIHRQCGSQKTWMIKWKS